MDRKSVRTWLDILLVIILLLGASYVACAQETDSQLARFTTVDVTQTMNELMRYRADVSYLPVVKHKEPFMNTARQEKCCPIVELRQYTLHPGQRDVLIELFDREFIESQEALGMALVGQFRDLDNANRFVWLRGFRDMPSRARALEDFYGGPVWKVHRAAANATMIDVDNVLLLRPARAGSEFQIGNDRPPVGAKDTRKGLIVATIYYFDLPVTDDFVRFFENAMKPALTEAGASVLAYFVTEPSKNNFPRLPVREGENVFVWFSSFRNETSYADHQAGLSKSQRWHNDVSPNLARRLKRSPDVLKLSPTERSRVRGQ
jgi:hypothetical protein